MNTGWQRVALGDVCDILDRRGITPEKLGSHFTSDGFRVISAKNIKERRIDARTGERRYVDERTYRRWMRSPLLADDVLLTSEAPLGEPAYVGEKLEWCLGQRLFGIRSDKTRLFGKFLFYSLQAPPVRDDLLSRATGATAQGIRQAELTRIGLPLPPLVEQRRIVRLLDQAFAGVATAKANADKNWQNASALFENYLQEVFTNKGNDWVEKRLGDVATFKNGLNFTRQSKGQTVPIVGVGDFQGNSVVPIESLRSVTIDGQLSGDYLIRRDDILTVRSNGSRDLVGRCMLVPDVAGMISYSGFVIRIRFDTREICPRFLLHFMKAGATRDRLTGAGGGTNISNISQEKLSALPLHLPPLRRQESIAKRLDALATHTQRLENLYRQKIDALNNVMKSLLHKAFSGAL